MNEPVGRPTSPDLPRWNARGPEDVLAWIPYTLGYTPSERLVTVTSKNNALVQVLSLDLSDPALAHAHLSNLVDVIAAGEPDSMMIALYTESFRNRWDLAVRTLHSALSIGHHIPVRHTWLVTPGTWEDYFRGPDHRIHPTTELINAPAACEMILRGYTNDWRTSA
jgi:hypothetical protein